MRLSVTKKSFIPQSFMILLLVSGLFSGCTSRKVNLPIIPEASSTIQTTATSTVTAVPTIEPSATQPPTSTPEPTLTPPASFIARVNANFALLRTGPGSMHQPVTKYPYGSNVTITGKAAGDEWVLVQAADQNTGWMPIKLLDIDYPLTGLPLQEPADTALIYGVIQDSVGNRLGGVGVSVCSDLCYQMDRTDAVTNQAGEFFAYVPITLDQNLRLYVSSVICASPIMNAECKLTGKFLPEEVFLDELPPSDPVLFMYYPE